MDDRPAHGAAAVMFKLRRPCANCPFRRSQGWAFGLRRERLKEIVAAPAFQCHKTVDYDDDDPAPGERPQQCAGLMAVLHRAGRPNQIMQVAERLGHLDPDRLDPDNEAYGSLEEAFAEHARLEATT